MNGKEVDLAVMRALNSESIKSITVIKDKATLEEEYGEKGKNGVLLITLKENYMTKVPNGETGE